MKKNLLFILVLALGLLINASYSQTGWTEQTNPLGIGDQAMLGKVQFVSATEGWISCGNGSLLHTTNAGADWVEVVPFPTDTIERWSDPAMSMSWVGTTHGWIMGTIGSLNDPKGAIMYYTTNGGANWQKKIFSQEAGTFGFEVQFVDENNGWVLYFNFNNGQAGFEKTTDGGSSWTPTNGAGIFYYTDVNNGWAYTGSGTDGSTPPFKIYNTTDGGSSWNEQFNDVSNGSYNAIMFSDINNGWVVGANGKVIRTTDGGKNWSFVTNTGINPNQSCKTVFFLDANNGWIPSKTDMNAPYICHTTNGGQSWETQQTPFADPTGYNAIFSINFWDINNGWLTADLGRIAHYTNVSAVKSEALNLNEFRIDQNYPNPFNPSTAIRYSLAKQSFVQLKVYNLIGQEVATLVNQEKSPGNYEVNFNAINLPSGVYIYKMQAGEFVQTKKMILLK